MNNIIYTLSLLSLLSATNVLAGGNSYNDMSDEDCWSSTKKPKCSLTKLSEEAIKQLDPQGIITPYLKFDEETKEVIKQLEKEPKETRPYLNRYMPRFLESLAKKLAKENGMDQIVKGIRKTPIEKRDQLCSFFTPNILQICRNGWEVEDIMREFRKVPFEQWDEIYGYLAPQVLANCGPHGGYDVGHVIRELRNERPELRKELALLLNDSQNWQQMKQHLDSSRKAYLLRKQQKGEHFANRN